MNEIKQMQVLLFYFPIPGCNSQFLQYFAVHSEDQEHVPDQILPV